MPSGDAVRHDAARDERDAIERARVDAVAIAAGAREFFACIDRATMGAGAPLEASVLAMRRRLDDRTNGRAVHGSAGRAWRAEPLDTSTRMFLARFATRFGHLVRDAEQHLRPAGRSGVGAFEWAFELFVTGRLAVAHPDPALHRKVLSHGAPDGAPFLLFAELASVSLDLEVEPAYWRARFAPLVRVAVLFAAHPAPDLGVIRERGIAEAESTSRYTFYDGKVVPLGDAFELRERFNRVLEPLEWRERRALLEDALTWAAARVVGDTGARPRDGERALDPRVAQLVPEA